MENIEKWMEKIKHFLFSNNGMCVCIPLLLGWLYKYDMPGIRVIMRWGGTLILKLFSIPTSVITALYQFLSCIYYSNLFVAFSIIWILVMIGYILFVGSKEKDYSYAYMKFRGSIWYQNIFTKIWFKLISTVWYLYKATELSISGDIKLLSVADWICFLFCVTFTFLYMLSTFQRRD